MLLDGKRLLITGVLTEKSIAYAVADRAIAEGAEVVLTGFGRGMRITERMAKRLPGEPDVLELDVNEPDHFDALAADLSERWGGVDGALHAIAFAPPDALGGNFLQTPWDSVATAFRTSAYSLKEMAARFAPLMDEGGAIASMDFDASQAWPIYDWMGVSKAALESVTRYLARDLGPRNIRVNCLAAGPLRTMAAKGIPGFDHLAGSWAKRAPLGWDTKDASPVARTATFLLSDWSAGITGEIIHVDGGFHAIGTELLEAPQER
jgi:enoyl-[acyl-carrier protein] reductase I